MASNICLIQMFQNLRRLWICSHFSDFNLATSCIFTCSQRTNVWVIIPSSLNCKSVFISLNRCYGNLWCQENDCSLFTISWVLVWYQMYKLEVALIHQNKRLCWKPLWAASTKITESRSVVSLSQSKLCCCYLLLFFNWLIISFL